MSVEEILLGKQYASIEIFSDSKRDRYAYLEAERKKNEILISRKEIFNTIEQLQENISRRPSVLIINNHQVLQKEISGRDENDKKAIHQAFPNLKLDDFIYEIWRKENSMLIAICRKSYIEQLCQSLDKLNLVGISFGVCAISSIIGFPIPDTLYTNTHTVSLTNDGNLINILNNEHAVDVDINGLFVPNTHLLPFCGILKLIVKIGNSGGTIADYNSALFENYKQKSFFQKGLATGITLIIFLLLINFFLFTYYFDKSQKLNEDLALNSSSVEAVAKVKHRIAGKEEKLKSFATDNTSRSALIINDIVRTLPSSILLSELHFHPLEKKIKAQEAILSNDSIILVSGNTLSAEAFTNWISGLEKNKFISSVTITSYGKDDNSHTTFKIRINLKQ